MRNFIIKRFLKGILNVFFIWSLIFVLVRLTGDPTEWMLPEGAAEEVIQALRRHMGLDLPLWKQYINSFASLLRGEMGDSYYFKRDVAELFAERFSATLSLAVPALSMAAFLGIILGVFAAVRHDTYLDRATMVIAIAGYTIPNFVLGIMLIFVFSLKLKIFPSGSIGTTAHYVLPMVALLVGPMANIARLTRGSMLDTLRKEYLDGARMKGVRESVVIFKHALRNSLIPVVTTVSMQLGTIIGGSVVVETVFAWPGIGSLIVSAAKNRDFPVVQYGVLLIACTVTLANILVDISYGYLNPRIRESFK